MKVGDSVRVKDPASYIADVRKKVDGGRVGTVSRAVAGLGRADSGPNRRWVVEFPAADRRRAYSRDFTERSLEVVNEGV